MKVRVTKQEIVRIDLAKCVCTKTPYNINERGLERITHENPTSQDGQEELIYEEREQMTHKLVSVCKRSHNSVVYI